MGGSTQLRVYLSPPVLLGRDEKLALDVFRINEADPHLAIVDQQICRGCRDKPCTVTCPVDNYCSEEDGRTTIYWSSCVECGACRVICPYRNIAWKYPAGGYGVSYRYG